MRKERLFANFKDTCHTQEIRSSQVFSTCWFSIYGLKLYLHPHSTFKIHNKREIDEIYIRVYISSDTGKQLYTCIDETITGASG